MNLPDLFQPMGRVRCGRVLPQLLFRGGEHVISNQESGLRGTSHVTFKEGMRILTTPYGSIGQTAEEYVLSNRNNKQVWLKHPRQHELREVLERGESDWREVVRASWQGRFSYLEAGAGIVGGLRAPQIGALHAIAAHWSLRYDAATVVMPTGTGKTETMLAALIAHRPSCLLVVVPSSALRKQVSEKFQTLGILPNVGVVAGPFKWPVVGVLTRRPRGAGDLEIFRRCNVVVTTAAAIAQGTSEQLIPQIAALCSHLIIDEAHHVAASSWSKLKTAFGGKPVLQFTATPFREDAKPIEGKMIYNYPLSRALEEGYFQRINVRALYEYDLEAADAALAREAVGQLRQDMAAHLDHRIMARCHTQVRAAAVLAVYQRIAPDLNPVMVVSATPGTEARINDLRSGASRIVVCVNMLAEGFDMPQLKVAAVHDKHKSLAVLLQFVGRFARTRQGIGIATVVVNTADETVDETLQRLYDEDPDWSGVVAQVHALAVAQQERLSEFLEESQSLLDGIRAPGQVTPLLGNLFPKISAVVFNATEFTPRQFFHGLPRRFFVRGAWLARAQNVLVVVGDVTEKVDWSSSRDMMDHDWHLYVVSFDAERGLLFIGSSVKNEFFGDLASCISNDTAVRIQDDSILRIFGGINRLRFIQAGVKRGGGRRHRYSMVAGQNVGEVMRQVSGNSAIPSNFTGQGYEGGRPCSAGCSLKGKVWDLRQGNVYEFVRWCQRVGAKIRDAAISPTDILGMTIAGESRDTFPDTSLLHFMWPDQLLQEPEVSVRIGTRRETAVPFFDCDIRLLAIAVDRKSLRFEVEVGNNTFQFRMELTGAPNHDHSVLQEGGGPLNIYLGSREFALVQFLRDEPPVMLFADGSEMEGVIYYPMTQAFDTSFPDDQLVVKDWLGIDIEVESIWRGGAERANSVQARARDLCLAENFELVFNDDDTREAADLVCMKIESDVVVVRLVHCKFSGAATPGSRIDDVVVVVSQATRSVRWNWSFEALCDHLVRRESVLHGKPTRYIQGDRGVIRRFKRESAFRQVRYEVICVQPGVSKANLTDSQRVVLGAANRYLIQTSEVVLGLWCSA